MKSIVSVIVPIYQAEKYLVRCIESIINQTYKELEIILVDDGSMDNGLSICYKYAQNDSRIKVIHTENNGLVRTRKNGLESAKGEYVYFVDADDYIEINTIEEMMLVACQNDCDIVIAGVIKEDNCEKWEVLNLFDEGLYDEKMIEKKIIPYMLYSGEYYKFGITQYLCNKLFKKSLIYKYESLVPDKVTCGEDVVAVYPSILGAKKIYILNKSYYHYIQNVNSMTAIQSKNFAENVMLIYRTLKEQFESHNMKNKLLYQLEYYMLLLSDNAKKVLVDNNIKNDTILFPFEKVKNGSRIILYGAGKYGKIYYEQIKQSGYCKIVEWIDDENDIINIGIEEKKYDYLVVTVKQEKAAEKICKQLVEKGVNRNKIVY